MKWLSSLLTRYKFNTCQHVRGFICCTWIGYLGCWEELPLDRCFKVQLGCVSGRTAEQERGVAWHGVSKGLLWPGLGSQLGEKPLLHSRGGGCMEVRVQCHHSAVTGDSLQHPRSVPFCLIMLVFPILRIFFLLMFKKFKWHLICAFIFCLSFW